MAKKADGELKIEKGVPVPARIHGGNSKGYTSTLLAMKRGESVLLPTKMSSAIGIAQRCAERGSFTMRTVEGGTRVWRIR